MHQNFEKLSRRGFLKLSAAAVGVSALTVLAACSPAAPAESGSAASAPGAGAEKVEISFYEWGTALDKQVSDSTIADFQAANPNITVRLEQAPGGQHYDKLQASLAGGTAADVINNQTWLWQSFSAKGVYAALDDLRARDDYNTPYPDAWANTYDVQTKFRGKLFGVPWNMGAMLIFYSKAPFDRVGIPYPTADWTYDEFVELTQQLTEEVDGVQHYGYQTNTSYERLASWMRLNGDKEWDQEIEPTKAMWDQEYIMDMINFQLYACVNEFKVSPTPAMMEGGLNDMDSGNVAMTMEGPWFFPKMACGDWACTPEQLAAGGVPYGVVQMPKSPKGTRAHMVFGHVVLLNNASKHQDEAWEFMKFQGGEGAQKYVATSGRQPVTPEFNEKYWFSDTKEKWGLEDPQPFLDAFESGVLHVAGEVDDRVITNEVFGPARDRMIAGDADAYTVVPEMNAKIQEMLDAYWEKQKS